KTFYLVVHDEAAARRLPQLAAQGASFLVEHVAQEPGPAHDPGHPAAAVHDTLGDLVADEAAAHHQRLLGGVGALDDGIGVVDGLEAEHVVDLVRARPG